MATTSAYTPERLRTVTPYLCARNAQQAIDWYKEVFEAVELRPPVVMPDGKIGHAELQIGDSVIMLADEYEAERVRSPLAMDGTSVQLMVYVPDVDAVFDRAVASGAHVWRPVEQDRYGSRTGKIRDPFGHNWFVSTQTETSGG